MTRLLALFLILVLIPVTFLYGGGVEGNVIPWLIFVYLYIGLMLTGAWRITMLLLHTAIVSGMLRRISRGGAFNRKDERNSRTLPAF